MTGDKLYSKPASSGSPGQIMSSSPSSSYARAKMEEDNEIKGAAAYYPKHTIIYYPPSDEESSSTVTPAISIHENLGQIVEPPVSWKQILMKICFILILLYFFVCSLGFLSDSFRLIAGKAAGEALQKETLISNPIVGVMMGILVTVAVQSSSTATSIVVSLVSSGLFSVKTAIPITMGANLGTSITNTVVALTHMTNRDDFERAFAGAVLHDMFNLLTVTSLLFLEKLTSYLEVTSTRIINTFDLESKKGGEIQVLSLLTKPLTSMVIQINKDVIIGWSVNDPKYDHARLLKVWCNSTKTFVSSDDDSNTDNMDIELTSTGLPGTSSEDSDEDDILMHGNKTSIKTAKKCKYLFNMFDLGDLSIGLILLAISLVLLCGCLVCIVKVLSSLLKGKLAVAVQKAVNADIPYFPYLTGYLAMGIGAIMTILVQSSSVFTSALTPLIAMNMISLERAYPLTLGSNLGTTTTAMLAALATEGPNLKYAIQLALCHFLFNLTGILLFYPIPFTRFPIPMAAALGRVTAKYRWFAVFYLVFMFLLLPLIVFSLSMLGSIAFYIVSVPIGMSLVFVLILHFLQRYAMEALPDQLKTWNFLPTWLRSLEPYDRIVEQVIHFLARTCCGSCCKTAAATAAAQGAPSSSSSRIRLKPIDSVPGGIENMAFIRGNDSVLSFQQQTVL